MLTSSYQSKKFRLRLIAAVAAFFYWLHPSVALAGVSTVDAFAEQHPAEFKAIFGASTEVAGDLAPVDTAKTVSVDVIQDGQTVSTTSATVQTVSSSPLGAVKDLVTTGFTILQLGGLTASSVTSLQNKALNKYCTANSGNCTHQTITVTGHSSLPQYYGSTPKTVTLDVPNYNHYSLDQNSNGNGFTLDGQDIVVDFFDASGNKVASSVYSSGSGWSSNGLSVTVQNSPPVSWKDLSQDVRNTATNLLSDSDYADAATNGGAVQPSGLPTTGGPIELHYHPVSGTRILNDDGTSDLMPDPFIIFLPAPGSANSPSPSPSPSGNPSPSSSPSSSSTSSPSSSSNPSSSSTSDPSSSSTSDPSSSFTTSPGSSSSPSTGSEPSVTPVDFSKSENFVTHAINVFKSKFPFDIMGNLTTTGNSSECPNYTFFTHKFELCPIRDFLNVLEIPGVIAFLVWCFMSI